MVYFRTQEADDILQSCGKLFFGPVCQAWHAPNEDDGVERNPGNVPPCLRRKAHDDVVGLHGFETRIERCRNEAAHIEAEPIGQGVQFRRQCRAGLKAGGHVAAALGKGLAGQCDGQGRDEGASRVDEEHVVRS